MRRKLVYFAIFYALGMAIPVLILDSLNKERGYAFLLGISFALLILLFVRILMELPNRELADADDDTDTDTDAPKRGNLKVLIAIPLGIGIMLLFLFNGGAFSVNQVDSGDIAPQSYSLKVVQVVKKRDHLELKTLVDRESGYAYGRDNIYCKHILLKVYNYEENPELLSISPYEMIGSIIRCSIRLERPEPSSVPRGFDYRAYLYGKGIGMTGTINYRDIRIVNGSRDPRLKFKRWVALKRENFLKSFPFKEDEEALVNGILFGLDEKVDEDTYEDFQLVGTAHILAVSGLHVGIIFIAYRKVEKRIKGNALKAGFILFLIIYGTAALWSVSVSRAILLILIKLLADSLELNYDKTTALAACFILELTISPFSLFSVGLQMSFLAALGIFHLEPFLERKLPPGLSQVLSVQGMLLPYIVFRFNRLPIIGLIANIPVIFLVSPLVILGVIGFLGFILFGFTPEILGEIMSSLINLIIWINNIFTPISGGNVALTALPLAIYYSIIIIVPSEFFQIYIVSRRNKLLLRRLVEMLASSLILVILATYSPFDRADLIFLDVGQGDACHIDWGKTDILIDGGGRRNYDIGKNLLKPYFLKNGEINLDLAIATHLDQDHFKGIEELEECFDVRETKTRGEWGERICLDKERYIDILWPLLETSGGNEESLVLRIYDRGTVALITGDISVDVEKRLIELYGEGSALESQELLKCHILKIAHHGSRYSTSVEFLNQVSPMVAIISVGKNNYGHPSSEVIEKLESEGIMIFRTDIDGSIGIIVRSGGFTVCTKKGPGLISFSTM